VVAILEPFPIDVLGLNCATGPEQMKEHVRYLSEHCPFVISCIPNAGLPENVGGVAHYRLTPIAMKMQLMHFVEDLGVQVIGDRIREGDERFFVNLSTPINATLATSATRATGTIRNDDGPATAALASAFAMLGSPTTPSASTRLRR
jgi:hypothetical protein